MAWKSVSAVLCCCLTTDEHEDLEDERSRLLPELLEPSFPESEADTAQLYYQRLHERLNHIVRSTEGKMVNVASQIPFNLHNQVLPPHASPSRSASRSANDPDEYYSPFDHHLYNYHRRRPRRSGPMYENNTYWSHSQSRERRDNSPQHPMTINPNPNPILNLRLFGYHDLKAQRGRTSNRNSSIPGEQSRSVDNKAVPELKDSERQGESTAPSRPPFVVKDVGDIVFRWPEDN